MKQPLITLIALLVSAGVSADARSLQLKDLPAPVQKTVQETLKGGEIKNISREVENGITQYEVESMLGGKHRDFNVDVKGKLVVLEEEVDIAGIPAAAKAAIEKRAGGGKVRMVETVTKGDSATLYEASFTSKAGKKGSIIVRADGAAAKD